VSPHMNFKFKMDIKSLSPSITQLIERKLGAYATSTLGNDVYYLLEAMNILISAVGKNQVKKHWELERKDFDGFLKKMEILNLLTTEVKIHYDPILDKKFDKKPVNEVQSMLKSYFIKSASKIAVMQRDIYDIFIFLVEITTIKNKTIPSDAFKILENSGTGKFDMTRRPMPNREMIRE